MKPLIIIQYPQGTRKQDVNQYRSNLVDSHPDYEFLFISEGVTLSIAHEGNFTVTEVLKGE